MESEREGASTCQQMDGFSQDAEIAVLKKGSGTYLSGILLHAIRELRSNKVKLRLAVIQSLQCMGHFPSAASLPKAGLGWVVACIPDRCFLLLTLVHLFQSLDSDRFLGEGSLGTPTSSFRVSPDV